MNFRSIAQLSDQLLRWSCELPRDIEVIAGVPRSGLLSANILALYLNVPLTDVDGLLHGWCYPSGVRRLIQQRETGGLIPDAEYLRTRRRVLVLDDSVLAGKAMRAARERIESASLPHSISYAAVYVSPRRRDAVDFACELLNPPRVFEWNLFHTGLLSEFFVTLEGVLCPPPAADCTAPDRYRAFLAGATPLMVPSREIGWIVTSRPESDRQAVEDWLDIHGFRYRSLLMVDGSLAGGVGSGSASPIGKAEAYGSTPAVLFLEDSLWQAVQIASMTGRPVLCTRTMQLVEPGSAPLRRSDLATDLHPRNWTLLWESITDSAKSFAKRVLPLPAQAAIKRRIRK